MFAEISEDAYEILALRTHDPWVRDCEDWVRRGRPRSLLGNHKPESLLHPGRCRELAHYYRYHRMRLGFAAYFPVILPHHKRHVSMPLPPTTTRRWMIAVAVAAFVAFARLLSTIIERGVQYYSAMRLHSAQARQALDKALASLKRDDIESCNRFTRQAAYHDDLTQKYRLAISRPWLPVPPDPPPPE